MTNSPLSKSFTAGWLASFQKTQNKKDLTTWWNEKTNMAKKWWKNDEYNNKDDKKGTLLQKKKVKCKKHSHTQFGKEEIILD